MSGPHSPPRLRSSSLEHNLKTKVEWSNYETFLFKQSILFSQPHMPSALPCPTRPPQCRHPLRPLHPPCHLSHLPCGEITPTLDRRQVQTPTLDRRQVQTPTLDRRQVQTPTLDRRQVQKVQKKPVAPTSPGSVPSLACGEITPTLGRKHWACAPTIQELQSLLYWLTITLSCPSNSGRPVDRHRCSTRLSAQVWTRLCRSAEQSPNAPTTKYKRSQHLSHLAPCAPGLAAPVVDNWISEHLMQNILCLLYDFAKIAHFGGCFGWRWTGSDASIL